MTRTACNMPNNPPTRIAHSNPTTPPKSEPNTAPANAPTKSIPSIPIFIIATRSDKTPAKAAKAIGVALIIVACNIPVKENDFPAVAQTKKQVINRKKPSPKYKFENELTLLIKSLTPKNTNKNDINKLYLLAGTMRFGMTYGSRGLDSLKIASPSTPKPKKNDINIPKTTSE